MQVAGERGVSAAQLATAWVIAKGRDIVPVVGARRPEQLAESLGALDIELSVEEIAAIEGAVPSDEVAGTRYDERLMRMLDSER